MDVASRLRASLGILTTAELAEAGFGRRDLERGLRAGAITRVRPGWFARDPHPLALAAVAAGGSVSCVDALEFHGAWRPHMSRGHVRHADHARQTRGRGARGCRPFGANPAVRSALDPVDTAFRCALPCCSAEQLVAVTDALLHRGIATEHEVRRWSARAPHRVRDVLDHVDPRSESGTESMVRMRLRAMRVSHRVQVWVDAGTRVDLLIGDRLVIECDSVEFHTDRVAYERDRARDRRLAARGYLVIRLTWRQIHDDWDAIERDLRVLVQRGEHRWRAVHRRNAG